MSPLLFAKASRTYFAQQKNIESFDKYIQGDF